MAKPTSLFSRIPWEEAYTAFLALDQKRQWLALAGAALVLVFLIILPISCAGSRLGKMESEYRNSQKNLASLAEAVSHYTALKGAVQKIETDLQKNKDVSLSTVLESLANEAGIGKNITSLKPRKISSGEGYEEQGLDVQLKEVPLKSLVDYLAKILGDSKVAMRVGKLQLKAKSSDRARLDVTFQVSTLVPIEK